MKSVWFLLIILSSFTVSCTPASSDKLPVEATLKELDETLSHKADYEQNKEQHLQSIKKLAANANTPENLYMILDKLYSDYYNYNNDSAFFYANIKRQLVTKNRLTEQAIDSDLDWAEVHLIAGMFKECSDVLDKIIPEEVDSTSLPKYYYLYRSLYRAMASIAIEDSLKKNYTKKGLEYLQKRKDILDPKSSDYLYSEVEALQNKQQNERAIELLLQRFHEPGTSLQQQAVLAYMIASSYQEQNEPEKTIYYYTLSAINDVKTATHKHTSLHRLANLLFETGDIERAYSYINYAMGDALNVNSRVNIHSITRLLPIIQQSHDQMMKEKRRQLYLLITGISLLSVCLLVTIFIVYKNKKKVSDAKHQLAQVNEELKEVNSKLTYTNTCLQESNNIKEAYIGYYMDLCSTYINKVEEYRNNLNNIARNGGANEVMKALRKPSFLKNDLDAFYESFDSAFLKIFPDFVKQFNALLQEDKRIDLKQDELLNTELRIFALIRLGIGDSIKIAEFLRRSPSTIYNYRVKYRNAAINNRDDFDNQVRNIGQ
ncbi:hypothetical protein H8744_05125 [Oscillospiraceae bacterium N12]|jgi:hypothetical protein|uniref:DUF6377 domain-containing protein n=1 Tax=Jilunia laotingensis TaxID=2763675 RepID=A0A926F264_9BACT|nr:DUF6377 domain-containing protein [Jilunia laotingensis]MBC8592640.1 hypothetical protein [Jilunia laotingensis]